MSLAEPATLSVAAPTAPRLHVLRRAGRRLKVSLPAYLLLLPSLVFLALFTYGAMGRVLIDALYQRATPKAPVRFVGLDNIAAVLADPAFTGAVLRARADPGGRDRQWPRHTARLDRMSRHRLCRWIE